MDDILVIYKEDKTNIHMMLEDFSNLAPSMKFTLEEEQNNRINFLDITITKNQEGLSFEIYRKPTATDILIPNDSCHPREHKTAAIRYYYNRMKTYQQTAENRQKDKDNIRQILTNNKYDASSLEKFNDKKKRQRQNNQRWAKFTYVGKEIRFITKLFKNTNVKVAFTTDNTIGKHLTIKQETPQNKYERSGVYQLTCPECKMKYTGQTGRPCKVRFQEHLWDYKYNYNRSKFAQHLINKHAIGKMEDIMEVVHITRKGKMMETLEGFHIYKVTKAGNQINDRLTVKENAIFETVIQEDPYRGRADPPLPNS